MLRGSRFALVGLCAYVIFAFACNERSVEAEFDYSVAQQNAAVALVTGVWEDDDGSVRVTVCEGNVEQVSGFDIAISGNATAPLHAEINECNDVATCGIAFARCASRHVRVPLALTVVGSSFEGSYEGSVDLGPLHAAALDNPLEQSREWRASASGAVISGTFFSENRQLSIVGLSSDAGASVAVGTLNRVSDASCP